MNTPAVIGVWVSILVIVALMFIFDVNVVPSNEFLAAIGRGVPSEESSSATSSVSTVADDLAAVVVPEDGYTLDIVWGDTGKKLIESGAIDLEKYRENYSDEKYAELLAFLTDFQDGGITITKDNAYFWVNTLWALGLAQKSDVLDKGVMGTDYKDRAGSFASTGGWTLGSKDAMELYSAYDIISLTADQQILVHEITKNIYRPCCDNPTSFPDCNHGMAMIGLVELMVSQGFSEDEVYEVALVFNSYWFAQTYIDLAYYFETKGNVAWADVDPRLVLSKEFSSASGYGAIKKQIGNIPGVSSGGGSCGA